MWWQPRRLQDEDVEEYDEEYDEEDEEEEEEEEEEFIYAVAFDLPRSFRSKKWMACKVGQSTNPNERIKRIMSEIGHNINEDLNAQEVFTLPIAAADQYRDINEVESEIRESIGFQLDKNAAEALGGPASGQTECVLTTRDYMKYVFKNIPPNATTDIVAKLCPFEAFQEAEMPQLPTKLKEVPFIKLK